MPVTIRRFSLTENWTKAKLSLAEVRLTVGLSEVNDGVIVLEHVNFVDVLEGLHAEFLDSCLELLILVDGLVGHNLLSASLGT